MTTGKGNYQARLSLFLSLPVYSYFYEFEHFGGWKRGEFNGMEQISNSKRQTVGFTNWAESNPKEAHESKLG